MSINYSISREVMRDPDVLRYARGHARVIQQFSRNPCAFRVESDNRELKDLDAKMERACAGLLRDDMGETKSLIELNKKLETKIEAAKKKKYRNYPVEDFIITCKNVKIDENSVFPAPESVDEAIQNIFSVFSVLAKTQIPGDPRVAFARIESAMTDQINELVAFPMMDRLCKLTQMRVTEEDCTLAGPDVVPAFLRFLISHWTRQVESEVFSFLTNIKLTEDCISIPRTEKLLILLLKTDTANWSVWELYARLLFVKLLLTGKIVGPRAYRWDLS